MYLSHHDSHDLHFISGWGNVSNTADWEVLWQLNVCVLQLRHITFQNNTNNAA
jgi:hypothetical protein